MIPKLTPEQRSLLQPYERHLHTAAFAGYVVALPARVKSEVLWPMFREVFDTAPGNTACNQCVINVCRRLGRLYFAEEPQEGAKQPSVAAQTAGEVKSPTEAKNPPQKTKNPTQKAEKAPKKKTNKK